MNSKMGKDSALPQIMDKREGLGARKNLDQALLLEAANTGLNQSPVKLDPKRARKEDSASLEAGSNEVECRREQ